MLDVLVVWLIWVRTLPRGDGAASRRRRRGGAARWPDARARPMKAESPLAALHPAQVLAWLPVTFVVWYFAAPLLLWPALALLAGRCASGFGDLVRDVEQARRRRSRSRRRSSPARRSAGGADHRRRQHAAVLVRDAAVRGARARRARAALAAHPRASATRRMLPFVAWGVLADFLKNVAITAGPPSLRRPDSRRWQREVIAFAYPVRLADPADRRARGRLGADAPRVPRAAAANGAAGVDLALGARSRPAYVRPPSARARVRAAPCAAPCRSSSSAARR